MHLSVDKLLQIFRVNRIYPAPANISKRGICHGEDVITFGSIIGRLSCIICRKKEDNTMRNNRVFLIVLSSVITLLVVGVVRAEEPTSAGEASTSASTEGTNQQNLQELTRQLTNPVSSVWSLTFQFNNFFLEGAPSDQTRFQSVLNFQPVLPFHLTKDLNLIVRPVLPFIFTSPVFTAGEGFSQKSGFGDMALVPFLSPAHSGNWLIGVGPTFIFPTAGKDERLGQGQWQLGPAGVIGYFTKKFIVGVFPQQWWSYAGEGPSVSQANIQYFAFLFLPNAWQVGTAPNILINWKADNDNKLTFPVGLQVGKTVRLGKLPVNFALEGQWMPAHPDTLSQRWNIQLVIKPVIPSLIPGTLF